MSGDPGVHHPCERHRGAGLCLSPGDLQTSHSRRHCRKVGTEKMLLIDDNPENFVSHALYLLYLLLSGQGKGHSTIISVNPLAGKISKRYDFFVKITA